MPTMKGTHKIEQLKSMKGYNLGKAGKIYTRFGKRIVIVWEKQINGKYANVETKII